MAGIKANSASVTMVDADTSVDSSISGYLAGEQVTLSVTPTGTTYQWEIAKPSDATSRSDLTDDDSATVKFTPDVDGYFTVSVTVNGTTSYVLRISVADVAYTPDVSGLRFMPVADSSVTAPATGRVGYYSATQSLPVTKDSDGNVRPLSPLSVTKTYTATLLDSDADSDDNGTFLGGSGSGNESSFRAHSSAYLSAVDISAVPTSAWTGTLTVHLQSSDDGGTFADIDGASYSLEADSSGAFAGEVFGMDAAVLGAGDRIRAVVDVPSDFDTNGSNVRVSVAITLDYLR